jgi:hypothetical protein
MVKSKIEYSSDIESDEDDNIDDIVEEVIKQPIKTKKEKVSKELIEEVKPIATPQKKQLSEAKLKSIENMRRALIAKREAKAKEDFEIKTKIKIKNKINRKVQKEVSKKLSK